MRRCRRGKITALAEEITMTYRQFQICLAMAMSMFGACTLRDLERLLDGNSSNRRTT
jgi:hypothetical protein